MKYLEKSLIGIGFAGVFIVALLFMHFMVLPIMFGQGFGVHYVSETVEVYDIAGPFGKSHWIHLSTNSSIADDGLTKGSYVKHPILVWVKAGDFLKIKWKVSRFLPFQLSEERYSHDSFELLQIDV